MTPRATAVPLIAQCTCDPLLGGISLAGLGALKNPKHTPDNGEPFLNPDNPANEVIEAPCSQGCGATVQVPRFWASMTACDECIAKATKKDALEKVKTYWEAICPPAFRDTDKKHADFPIGQYEATRAYRGEESLLLYGPSRTGKSRLAMLLIKRCLVRFGMHVGVLWPERLKSVKGLRDTLELVEKWGRYDLLLMDDALLSGAQDERVTDFLKDLLDYRMRFKRHHIITSQIGSDDYKEQADKFDNITKADMARVDALLKRVKETSRVIPFVPAKPKAGEEVF
jgi:hypothetical protein